MTFYTSGIIFKLVLATSIKDFLLSYSIDSTRNLKFICYVLTYLSSVNFWSNLLLIHMDIVTGHSLNSKFKHHFTDLVYLCRSLQSWINEVTFDAFVSTRLGLFLLPIFLAKNNIFIMASTVDREKVTDTTNLFLMNF